MLNASFMILFEDMFMKELFQLFSTQQWVSAVKGVEAWLSLLILTLILQGKIIAVQSAYEVGLS